MDRHYTVPERINGTCYGANSSNGWDASRSPCLHPGGQVFSPAQSRRSDIHMQDTQDYTSSGEDNRWRLEITALREKLESMQAAHDAV